jgi:hypothetical protein
MSIPEGLYPGWLVWKIWRIYILKSRGGERVSKLWAHRFVQRQLALKTRLNRVYNS